MNTVSILGCGWLGLPLGAALVEDGFTVRGSTTTPSRLRVIAEKNIEPFLIDLSRDESPGNFFASQSLVVCIPPKLKNDGGERYLEQMKRTFQLSVTGKIAQVVFVSSTSVYPELNRVVTEPDADAGSVLVQAENLFLANENFLTSVIRFAGLVGPGRNPGKFLSGKSVSGADAPVNIIHLDDCISIIRKALMVRPRRGVWSACSDFHPAKKDFYYHASRAQGLEAPKFIEDGPENFKIVSSKSLKEYFSYNFKYPDPMKMVY